VRKNIKKNRHSPRYAAVAHLVDQDVLHEVPQAIELVKKTATAKFVEAVEATFRLGVDPRKGDQNVRGITNLPHGTGKTKKVAVLAKGDLANEAEDAGADEDHAAWYIRQILHVVELARDLFVGPARGPQLGLDQVRARIGFVHHRCPTTWA